MDSATDFWRHVEVVWHTGVGGVDLGHVLIALGVFLLFLVLRRVLARGLIELLRKISRRTKNEIDDAILVALEAPIRFLFVVVGVFAATRVAPLPEDVLFILDRLVRSLIAFTIFWSLYQLVEPLSHLVDRLTLAMGHRDLRDSLRDFFAKLAKFAIACLGVVAVLEEWDFNVAALLGGLGLVGMAIAFGAQNLIANLFAGLNIFLDHVCERGEWIRTPDVEGTIESIGFRTTKIRRFDLSLVTIPNSLLTGKALVNFSRMHHRRIYWTIGLEYRTSTEQLRAIVEAIREHVYGDEAFETGSPAVTTLINVDRFGDSSIDVMLYCFTRTKAWGEWMEIKQDLLFRIKQIVEENGAAFAFPSRSLYLETLPFGTPEIFPASAEAKPAE